MGRFNTLGKRFKITINQKQKTNDNRTNQTTTSRNERVNDTYQ